MVFISSLYRQYLGVETSTRVGGRPAARRRRARHLRPFPAATLLRIRLPQVMKSASTSVVQKGSVSLFFLNLM